MSAFVGRALPAALALHDFAKCLEPAGSARFTMPTHSHEVGA